MSVLCQTKTSWEAAAGLCHNTETALSFFRVTALSLC